MTDHEWLIKVKTAYLEYAKQFPSEAVPAGIFVRWLYSQYGIVFKDSQ